MEYPSGNWKYCSCGESYFLYDDGVGVCSSCAEKRRKREAGHDRYVARLRRENKKLKAKLLKQALKGGD